MKESLDKYKHHISLEARADQLDTTECFDAFTRKQTDAFAKYLTYYEIPKGLTIF